MTVINTIVIMFALLMLVRSLILIVLAFFSQLPLICYPQFSLSFLIFLCLLFTFTLS